MTIKEFSRLCNCNSQTLRYYDSIDLLKPARVDNYTGYRYYDDEQALDYVKIKNLQDALFSIDEIKELLNRDDDAIAKALDVKIAEQKAKLERIIQIQKSYRSEYMKMQEIIKKAKSVINESVGKYDVTEEYGIREEDYREIVSNMFAQYDQAVVETKDGARPDNGEKEPPKNVFKVKNEEADDPRKDGANVIVIEESGWKHTAEVLEKLPPLNGEFILYFELDDERWSHNDFCPVVLSIVQNRNKDYSYKLTCTRNKSKDGRNHFWLLRRKSISGEPH